MLFLLLLLGAVPILAHRIARRHFLHRRACITGIALGSVVAPLSMGLYATFYWPYVGLIPGLIGLASSLFHGAPGYEAAIALGLMPSHHVAVGIEHLYVFGLSAIVWALIYGGIGWFMDRHRRRKGGVAPEPIAR